MPIQFTTEGVPDSRRLALWQDIVCDVYGRARLQVGPRQRLSRLGDARKLGKRFARRFRRSGSMSSVRPRGSRARIEEFILVALGKHGAGSVVQDGRETVIQPGRVRDLRHHASRTSCISTRPSRRRSCRYRATCCGAGLPERRP